MKMPNKPTHAKEKRSHTRPRQNAQGDHEGSAHIPVEFDVMNPQKQGLGEEKQVRKPTPPSNNR